MVVRTIETKRFKSKSFVMWSDRGRLLGQLVCLNYKVYIALRLLVVFGLKLFTESLFQFI